VRQQVVQRVRFGQRLRAVLGRQHLDERPVQVEHAPVDEPQRRRGREGLADRRDREPRVHRARHAVRAVREPRGVLENRRPVAPHQHHAAEPVLGSTLVEPVPHGLHTQTVSATGSGFPQRSRLEPTVAGAPRPVGPTTRWRSVLPKLYDMRMTELPLSAARDHLGEIVSRAEHAHERTVLTRHGKAVAAVISIEDLRELEAAEDRADLAAAREALASEERRVPHSEVLAEFGLA
jgi:prevent-host-death family protein